MSLRSSSSLRLLRSSRRLAVAAASSSTPSDGERRSRRTRTLRFYAVVGTAVKEASTTGTMERQRRAAGKWNEGGGGEAATRGFAAAATTTTIATGRRNNGQFSASSVLSSVSSKRGNGDDDGSTTEDDEKEEEKKISFGEDGIERREKEERTSENTTNGTNSINNKNDDKNNGIVNIPNALSVGRALSGPIIAHMIVRGPETYSTELVLASIAAAGVSDYLDGYLARRWNQTSNFGSFFDAAADKIFVSSVGVGMAASGQLPAWMIGLFVFRDCGFLASGFWRRANALKFENVTWRQYFAIDAVRREDERENRLAKEDDERRSSNMSSSSSSSSGSSSSNSSSGGGGISGEGGAIQKRRSDWEAFNSTEKWEPLYVGKVATALQMGLLAIACGQTLDHIPLLFETHEAQKHAISSLTENFGYFTFAATSYATAQYTKAYFSHPGWKQSAKIRAERRDARREHLRASVRDIRDSAKTKYDSFKRTSAEKISEEYRSRRRRRRREHEEAAALRVERVE